MGRSDVKTRFVFYRRKRSQAFIWTRSACNCTQLGLCATSNAMEFAPRRPKQGRTRTRPRPRSRITAYGLEQLCPDPQAPGQRKRFLKREILLVQECFARFVSEIDARRTRAPDLTGSSCLQVEMDEDFGNPRRHEIRGLFECKLSEAVLLPNS